MADAKPPTSGPLAVLAQLQELWRKQSKGRKTLAVAAVVGVIAMVGVSALGSRGDTYTVVSEGASPDDAQELLATLSARNLPVRLRDGKVEVATDRLDEARAIAAAAGLPHTGKGFELFDGANLGQSSFAEQVNFRRALQGELARSITALAQVQGARVHLALGKRSVFKDQDEAASASVALHLHAGQTLTADQVRGVRQLVAASVDGLRSDAVVVVDNHGNLLDGADPQSADHKANLERSLTSRVRAMLERVVGTGKVSVVTTATVDDRKVSETQELFDHANPVVRSESRALEGDAVAQGIGGVAGTRGNLPGAPAAGPQGPGAGSGSGNQRLQETKNYEISRTVRQTTKPDIQLQKLNLAIVVDYKTADDGKRLPRTDKELAELTALARQAAGVDDARGDKLELRSIPFAIEPDAALAGQLPPPGLPFMYLAIGGGALLLVLAVIAVLVLRARRRRAQQKPLNLALPVPVGDFERVIEARPSDPAAGLPAAPEVPALPPGATVRGRVIEAVRGDVERTAEVLTAWLSEAPLTGAKP